MTHDHHHHARNLTISRKLVASAAATAVFLVVQLAVGLTSGSLALIGDALHNFTDAMALLLALFAVRLERKPPNEEKSYGYHRAGILAAFVNAGTLVAFTVYLFIEAYERFSAPRAVNDTAMFVTAIAGIALNVVITVALRREGKDDVNVRSAVMHMIGDAISSAGIVVAAILIRVTGSTVWDPAVTVLIGVLILWSSWGILRETVNLLLEGTPRGIDPAQVSRRLAALEGVYGVHHLHIWALGPSLPALSCHLMVGDVPVKTTSKLLDEVNALLHREYNIVHSTVQFEYANCAEDDPYCIPYSARSSTER